jgi:hypothetical protein
LEDSASGGQLSPKFQRLRATEIVTAATVATVATVVA